MLPTGEVHGKIKKWIEDDGGNNFKINPTFSTVYAKLFDFDASGDFLRFCKERSIGILGVEGFYLEAGNLVPQLDWIADFSGLLEKEDYIDQSIQRLTDF